MESAAVRLYFLLEHNYSLVTMSCILHIIWVNSCTRNKINFSKDNIARGLCTLVLFIDGSAGHASRSLSCRLAQSFQ